MKHIFIVNPTSGAGRGEKIGKNIERVAPELGLDYEIFYTTRGHEATEIAKKYKKGEYIIYSVGGDGTLLEVLNGIIGTKNMLAVVPAGSGNDYYKSIKDREELSFPVDVGKVNDTYFLNCCSFGIDAEIGHNAELMKEKKIPRSQIYNASIAYTFVKYKFKEVEFVLNGAKKTGEYTIVTIMNGKTYGGGWTMAPNADISDGMFDIYFVDRVSKASIPGLLLKVLKGTHEESPHVHHRLADRIKFKTTQKVIVSADGETLYDDEFDVRLLKHAITIYNDKELLKKILD